MSRLSAPLRAAMANCVPVDVKGYSPVNVLSVDMPEAAELLAAGIKAGCENAAAGDVEWRGANAADTVQRCQTGNAALVSASDALVSEFEQIVDFPTSRAANVRAVAGGAVSVPAYLSGRPNCMIQRRQVITDVAPLNIMLDICVSAGISHETIARRGAATLALVRLVSAVRPVTLYALAGETAFSYDDSTPKRGKANGVVAIRLDTAPLDLARAAWLLGSTEAVRRLGFWLGTLAAGYPHSASFNWLFDDADKHKKHIYEIASKGLGIEQFLAAGEGVYLPDISTFDTQAAATEWLKSTLNKFTGNADLAA